MERPLKIFAAEMIGTAVLMMGGPGAAILGKGIGTLYDRFRGRLIIPIRESGRTRRGSTLRLNHDG